MLKFLVALASAVLPQQSGREAYQAKLRASQRAFEKQYRAMKAAAAAAAPVPAA